jgi:hypothetical protein
MAGGRARRTDCSKEIAFAEAQAAVWRERAHKFLAEGREDRAAAPLMKVHFYMTRAERMRPKMEAAE